MDENEIVEGPREPEGSKWNGNIILLYLSTLSALK